MEVSNDKTLHDAMLALDSFYANAAVLMQTAKEMLVEQYGFEEARDARIAYSYGSSIRNPMDWLPSYLCLYVRKPDAGDYISLLIALKNPYEANKPPLDSFYLYGFKFPGVRDIGRLDTLCRRAAMGPVSEEIRRVDKQGFSEISLLKQDVTCGMIRQRLWDISDAATLGEFIRRVVDL